MRLSKFAVPLVLGFALTVTGCANTGGVDSMPVNASGSPGEQGDRSATVPVFETSFYRLMYDLELTEAQEPIVRGILEDEQTARRALMEETDSASEAISGESGEMRAEMEALHSQTAERLRLVLTAEQMDVYRAHIEEQREAMESRRESGEPGGRRSGKGGGRGGF